MSHNKQPSYNRHKKYEVSFATDDKFGHVYDANQNCLVNNNNPESSKPTNESTSLVRNNNQSNKAKVGMIESDTIRENNTRSLSKPTQLQSFSFSNIYCHLLRLISMDHDGVRFAARMSVILSLCTLFVLCRWNHQAFRTYKPQTHTKIFETHPPKNNFLMTRTLMRKPFSWLI